MSLEGQKQLYAKIHYYELRNEIESNNDYEVMILSHGDSLFKEKLGLASKLWANKYKVGFNIESVNMAEKLIEDYKKNGVLAVLFLRKGLFEKSNKVSFVIVLNEIRSGF